MGCGGAREEPGGCVCGCASWNRYSVDMRTGLCENLPNVVAARAQIQQVLMNLMMNGLEALRDAGGELNIKSQMAEDGTLLNSVRDTSVGSPIYKQIESI